MFDYLNEIKFGDNIISEINGKNKNMLMDTKVVKISKEDKVTYLDTNKETAILHISGSIKLIWEDKIYLNTRKSLFDEEPSCLHISKGVEVTIVAIDEAEILVQQTENDRTFESKLYTEKNIRSDVFGDGVAGGACRRIVRTIFDYNNAPYSNMVMGEVITYPGRWSSYPPHHHPQPEVYFYRFDKEQGFGACFIGEDTFKIKHNSVANIPGGLVHPQTSAPGYGMYYCWMIRHLKDNPWTSRIDDEAHTWIMKDDAKIWEGK
ncbi:5-deoxy-glucuronate isomerase [Clostridium paraputrificum]|uniref:5-deoxy-glucuronate isomerase n=1 Tax=Clostridium paraputrificum TaxID=29363 RepID=UPI003D33087F